MDVPSSTQPNDRLRQERARRNWRQQDLADQLETTVVTVKRWERGSQQPSAYFRLKLCELFDKSAEELGLAPEERKEALIQRQPEAISKDELEMLDTEVKIAHAPLSPAANTSLPSSTPPIVPIRTPSGRQRLWLIGSLALVAVMIIVSMGIYRYVFLSVHANPIQTRATAIAHALDAAYNNYVAQQGMMFGFGPQHTRENPYEHVLSATTISRLSQKWSVPVVASTQYYFTASPIVANGMVYVSSADDKVYAFDALTGRERWSSRAIGVIYSSPAVVDNIVYVGSADDKVYALDALTGQQIWSAPTSGMIYTSPAVVNGIVYIGSQDHNLYALNALTGKQIWRATAGGGIGSSPAVANGIVYFGADDGKLYAFDALTGQWRWSTTTGARIFSSPAVANGIVYVGSWDNTLYAINALTGQRQWSITTGSGIESSPAVANGIVYFGSWDNTLYALDARTGQPRWSFTVSDRIESSPTVANGIVYFGSLNDNLYACDALTGQKRWSAPTSGMIGSSLAVANGMVYASSHDNKLYAFALY
jgi:outer membrane protein assembly factor BamB/transcriptional regulator with XRE-family HTH domain